MSSRCLLCFILLVSIIEPCGGETDPAILLAAVMRAITPPGDSTSLLSIESCRPGMGISRKGAYFFNRKGEDTFLVTFIAPDEERGIGWLFRGSESWGYAPRVRRFFAGNQNDIALEPLNAVCQIVSGRFASEYRALQSSRVFQGPYDCYEIELEALDRKSSFPFIVLYAIEDTLVPVKAVYEDRDREAVTTCYFYKWKLESSVYYPSRVSVSINRNARETDSYTILFENTNVSVLPDFLFTRAFCEYIGN